MLMMREYQPIFINVTIHTTAVIPTTPINTILIDYVLMLFT